MRKFIKKNWINIVTILLSITLIALGSSVVYLSNTVNVLQETNDKQFETIEELANKLNAATLKNQILETQYTDLKEEYDNLTEKIEEEKKDSDLSLEGQNMNPSEYDSGFRSWMPYTAITDKSSKQYKVVHMATPGFHGILSINEEVVVAVGTGWNVSIGDEIKIITEKGSYYAVVGDYKANKDTDETNKITTSNGCAVEFIVSKSDLDSKILKTGTVSTIDEYSGKVLNIESTGNNVLD